MLQKIGFLYDKSQDSSTSAIQAAKDYLRDEHGISYVEKTGTTTGEIQAAADSLVARKSRRYFYTTGQHCYDSRTCDF